MQLRIEVLPFRLAICRLDPAAPVPAWARGAFTSVTRTHDELSIVCDEDEVPSEVQGEGGWRVVRVLGPIPFEVTGVASALVSPLAQAQISVFPIATYDTDYLLLKADAFARALDVLRASGHDVA